MAIHRGTRDELLGQLAKAVERYPGTDRPTRVAIDGPDAAGKTTLADELAGVLRAQGHDVMRASIDGFHRPRLQRYRRGPLSPEGCYHDTYDYDVLRRVLLDPLGPDGTRLYQSEVFDHATDTAMSRPATKASAAAVLLFDGVFLLRPELLDAWDLRIFVSVAFDECLNRALARDLALFGSAEEIERRYRARYIPAQELYFASARPTENADVIVFNDVPQQPAWEIKPR